MLWRRGDPSIFDNLDMTELPDFRYRDPKGNSRSTHLYPGRGSIEKAINAIINAGTPWKHDGGLEVAYRYYYDHKRQPDTDLGKWLQEIDRPTGVNQEICFSTLTHGLAANEPPAAPPTVPPPTPGGETSLASVSGRIRNLATGEVVSGALVRLKQSDQTVYKLTTGSQGQFRFENVRPGWYRLVVTRSGYGRHFEYLILGSGYRITAMEVILQPALATSAEDRKPDGRPNGFVLEQNYPNPFSAGVPDTKISYEVDRPGWLSLAIYNLMGQRVRLLFEGYVQPGRYTLSWDGRGDSGAGLPNGVYLYKLTHGTHALYKRLTLSN